jgi:uncharacterized protein (DUF2147 family)
VMTLSERLRELIEEGKAEFIGTLSVDEVEKTYKAYYRITDNGKTYYIYDLVEEGFEIEPTVK